MINLIVGIISGALTGWIAGVIMKCQGSFLRNLVIGILGGVLCGWILGGVGWFVGAIGSVACACLVIWVFEKFLKK